MWVILLLVQKFSDSELSWFFDFKRKKADAWQQGTIRSEKHWRVTRIQLLPKQNKTKQQTKPGNTEMRSRRVGVSGRREEPHPQKRPGKLCFCATRSRRSAVFVLPHSYSIIISFTAFSQAITLIILIRLFMHWSLQALSFCDISINSRGKLPPWRKLGSCHQVGQGREPGGSSCSELQTT